MDMNTYRKLINEATEKCTDKALLDIIYLLLVKSGWA